MSRSVRVFILGTGVKCLFKMILTNGLVRRRVLGRPNQNLLSRPTRGRGVVVPFLLSLLPVLSDGAQRRHARREAAERFSNTVGRVGGGGGGRGILAACTFPLDGRDAAPLMGNAKTHRESRETHPLVLSRATLAISTVSRLFDCISGTSLTSF